ncbi:MAG: 50S ribosomal protein L15 [Pseudomonadota bacterium]
MRLNDLRDLPGATTSKKRVGRGLGSGLGKTSGHGQKGQKSRSGVAIKGFEGGQMPIHMRLPKRGFNVPFPKHYNEVNVGRIQTAIDDKKLDATKPVTVAALLEAGIIRRAKDGVRLLGRGELKAKVAFEVTGASSGAVKAVEAAGGSVTLTPMPRRSAKAESAGADKPAAKKSAPKKAAAKKTAAKNEKAE